jgi:(p)ppGpp synthase/HD superfamily hydrolase
MGETRNRYLIERALQIALEIHAAQTDRYGAPYILHVLTVGLRGGSEEEIAAGLLHDVVEDSDEWTIQRLEEEFPEEVVRVVDCLSKREGEEWEDYIGRVMTHPGAMRIKLADLEHNMTAQRAPEFGDEEYERFKRYVSAWHRIKNAMGE